MLSDYRLTRNDFARLSRSAALAAVLAWAGGCAQINDPFKDSADYSRAEMTTPSTDIYLANDVAGPPQAQRSWNGSDVLHENGAVTHWPLYFEDPFEDKGNDATDPANRDTPDNRFAWNGADYLHIAYGPTRFMVNMFGLPASAVVDWPGRLITSNGRLSRGRLSKNYDHDTEPAKPLDEPPDFNDLSRSRYQEHGMRDHPETATDATAPISATAPATDAPEVIVVE